MTNSQQYVSEEFADDFAIEIFTDKLSPEFNTRHVIIDVRDSIDSFPCLVEHHKSFVDRTWKKTQNVSKLAKKTASGETFVVGLGENHCNWQIVISDQNVNKYISK